MLSNCFVSPAQVEAKFAELQTAAVQQLNDRGLGALVKQPSPVQLAAVRTPLGTRSSRTHAHEAAATRLAGALMRRLFSSFRVSEP